MIELKDYKGNKYASAKDLHKYLEVKSHFSIWIAKSIKNTYIQKDKDFLTYELQSTGGRRSVDYYLKENAAIKIILQSRMPKSIFLTDYLIGLFKQKQNLELITPKQAALAYEYINFFKYIENQKNAYKQHQKVFISNNPLSKYIYSEFAEYREKITGWNKNKLDIALSEYLKTSSGINFTKLMKKSMSNKLSVIDVNEAIRVSVLDLLYSKGTNEELAVKFSNMVKNVSKEMNILAHQKNETNLFQQKENVHLKSIE